MVSGAGIAPLIIVPVESLGARSKAEGDSGELQDSGEFFIKLSKDSTKANTVVAQSRCYKHRM